MPKVWSSGVVFSPPSKKYWRIGGKCYDFRRFYNLHPGGKKVLKLARDRFEDCTYVFEAHHHESDRVRRVIKKYEVPGYEFSSSHSTKPDEKPPQFIDKYSFYSKIRERVSTFLKEKGYRGGGAYSRVFAYVLVYFLDVVHSLVLHLGFRNLQFSNGFGCCICLVGCIWAQLGSPTAVQIIGVLITGPDRPILRWVVP